MSVPKLKNFSQPVQVQIDWDEPSKTCTVCVNPWRAKVYSNPAKGPNKLHWSSNMDIQIEYAKNKKNESKSVFLGDSFTTGVFKYKDNNNKDITVPGKSKKEKSVKTKPAVHDKKPGVYRYSILATFKPANYASDINLVIDPEYEYEDDETENGDSENGD